MGECPPPLILRGAPKKWGMGAEKGKGAPKRGERRRNRQKSRKGEKGVRKEDKNGTIGGNRIKRGERGAPKCKKGAPLQWGWVK